MTDQSLGDEIRRSARVSGRVQGVSFRYHTVQQAERLGVTGWVRNTADRCVELEVQGATAAVEALLEWARTGPAAARVDRVDVTLRSLDDRESGFGVRY